VCSYPCPPACPGFAGRAGVKSVSHSNPGSGPGHVIQLSPSQLGELRPWFLPDRPGPLVGLHVLRTGNGACFADRWPEPGALLAACAGNYSLLGDPEALTPPDLLERISGFVDAPEEFLPLLQRSFPDLRIWDRVILELQAEPRFRLPEGVTLQRLQSEDESHLKRLSRDSTWISKTWGGSASLAASGVAWGAFVGNRLASVAVPFFVGERYEDIGVATEPECQGRGLSTACAGELVKDILARGRRASWSTSPDNTASLRVAEKLAFQFVRRDRLVVIGVRVPAATDLEQM